jgi:hypothetical protein
MKPPKTDRELSDQIFEYANLGLPRTDFLQEISDLLIRFFGCDAIGIQYQQGLKDMVPASDLAEGLMNNPERPPVHHAVTGMELFAGKALPHFNEVDECAGVDALITNFHLPQSTLIMLVSAFAGRDLLMEAYRQAINRKYQFTVMAMRC